MDPCHRQRSDNAVLEFSTGKGVVEVGESHFAQILRSVVGKAPTHRSSCSQSASSCRGVGDVDEEGVGAGGNFGDNWSVDVEVGVRVEGGGGVGTGAPHRMSAGRG